MDFWYIYLALSPWAARLASRKEGRDTPTEGSDARGCLEIAYTRLESLAGNYKAGYADNEKRKEQTPPQCEGLAAFVLNK